MDKTMSNEGKLKGTIGFLTEEEKRPTLEEWIKECQDIRHIQFHPETYFRLMSEYIEEYIFVKKGIDKDKVFNTREELFKYIKELEKKFDRESLDVSVVYLKDGEKLKEIKLMRDFFGEIQGFE